MAPLLTKLTVFTATKDYTCGSINSLNSRQYSEQKVAVICFPSLYQVPSTSGCFANCNFEQNIKKSRMIKCIISASTVMTQLLKFM